MAFWLARDPRGQTTDFIQRFDPRFWTVNFPRPMMASVVTTGPDALRVDCEFHHEGELAGLIWESEDTLDHPLLAYVTDKDYSRTVLRFDWQSSGLVPLDQPNGPTLTIEGRDETGASRSWYVRLWNYAVGSPVSATVTLPFSELQSGYTLPGEAVVPSSIDRMFISLAPPGYEAGGTDRLPARTDASVTLSNIVCEGDRPMLSIGDVMLPPHGEQIATAYDDALNQTPQRLLRIIRALGYRGSVLHYVGMSHFYRLAPDYQGKLLAAIDGTLCTPAISWHAAFFAECKTLGFEAIASLSYELFAADCHHSWQQLAFDGEQARTGWVPPSALLTPARTQVNDWLQAVAKNFVNLMKASDLPVRFQIGEPWWWVTPNTCKPCIYDYFVKQLAGGSVPLITDIRGPKTSEEQDYLDFAGSVLADSTLALADVVRAEGGPDTEVLLLAFTPTVLDPAVPELRRANLPEAWAYPAFDRLQLEDYDWLTAGADALRRTAYETVDARLGYPLDKQDYLSGFVLKESDADEYWLRIDAGLDEAASRGITRRFVWALPQISRDGYTRLAASQEDQVQAFDDVLYPLALGRDAGVSPEFSTSVVVTASGHERRNSLWSDARLRFDVGPGIRSQDELGTLISFFRARRGAARGFRLADPFDFSSNGMTGSPTMLDQQIGIGDGLRASYALVKHYGEDAGTEPQIRPITRARIETVAISVDGVANTDWMLDSGGLVTFSNAPAEGAIIRAGFLFDVPVRFAEDRIDITGAAFTAGEAPSIPLVEIREAV
ncbi:hypothetical protein HME9302_02228 [Alteripontixanthobacter maritimus]|uniref:TIGR02217 family protein n=1 Tax=Alteripontixanthobacter maritimus TaxID=2161824 RepID=A0A369Q803_9SPHN|nr:DUF2460 domain-containing protein [Alteripontixanthobacter maritimus]RDC61011.1 hypothetical protein HME9302_02228 [Alteripontixanthobacter maritimus]